MGELQWTLGAHSDPKLKFHFEIVLKKRDLYTLKPKKDCWCLKVNSWKLNDFDRAVLLEKDFS